MAQHGSETAHYPPAAARRRKARGAWLQRRIQYRRHALEQCRVWRPRRGEGRPTGDSHRQARRRRHRAVATIHTNDREFFRRHRPYRHRRGETARNCRDQHAGCPDRRHGRHRALAHSRRGARRGGGHDGHPRRHMDELGSDRHARHFRHRQASRHSRHGPNRPSGRGARPRFRHGHPLPQSPPDRSRGKRGLA